MIKLKQLNLAGFRSFKDSTDVAFPESGLTLIQGHNRDTGDSSGSGKSSLVLALQYLLGGCPFAGTDLKTWGEDAQPSVRAVFETPKGQLEVERSKGLSVKLNGKKLGGSAALAEKELCQIFGMDSSTRSIVTYRGQKKPGFFLSMSDGEKKEFLSNLLGLNKFEEAAEKAIAEYKKYESQKVLLEDRLKTLTRAANDWQDSMGMDPSNPEHVEFLKAKEQENLDRIHVLENDNFKKLHWINDKNKEYAELVDYEVQLIKAQRNRLVADNSTPEIQELEAKLANCLKKIKIGQTYEAKEQAAHSAQLVELQNRLKFLKKELERIGYLTKRKSQLETQLQTMAKDTCPTCQREWAEGKNSKTQKDLSLELSTVQFDIDNLYSQEKQIEAIQSQIAAYPAFTPNPVLRELEELREQLSGEINSLVSKNRATIQAEFSKLDQAEQRIRTKLAKEHEENILPVQQAIEENRTNINNWKKENITFHQEIYAIEVGSRNWQKQYSQLIEKQNAAFKAERDLKECMCLANVELDFAEMVGNEGFLGAIFDEVLADIGNTTNSILQKISNVQHVSIRFSSEKETKSGKVYKRITPVVSVGGQEVKPEAGLSGGMYTAVELAVDLAVGDVVSRRKGIYPGWLILDESFEGLGKASKQSCIEMLTEYAKDRLVLVIDHATELQSVFSQIIRVELLDGKSSIVHD